MHSKDLHSNGGEQAAKSATAYRQRCAQWSAAFALCFMISSFVAPASVHAQEAAAPAKESETTRTRDGQAKRQVSTAVALAGSFNLSTNGDLFFLNFGGPNVKLQIDDFRFHLSFFPSFKMYPDHVSFALGAGPIIGYKNFQVVMPIYVIADTVKPTFGLGYQF